MDYEHKLDATSHKADCSYTSIHYHTYSKLHGTPLACFCQHVRRIGAAHTEKHPCISGSILPRNPNSASCMGVHTVFFYVRCPYALAKSCARRTGQQQLCTPPLRSLRRRSTSDSCTAAMGTAPLQFEKKQHLGAAQQLYRSTEPLNSSCTHSYCSPKLPSTLKVSINHHVVWPRGMPDSSASRPGQPVSSCTHTATAA